MRQLGKIHCLDVINSDADETPWVILFHGYGADAADLFSLHEIISPKKTVNWLFPQGTLEVPIGPAWTGRAWWNIDMAAIEAAARRNETRDMSADIPAGLAKAEEMAMTMISQLKVPWDKIILGGFSQGAMLATQLYLKAPQTPRGLMILSGTLINQENWKTLASKRAGQNFFMSHGQHDPVLGIKQAQKLETLLTMEGMKGRLLSFTGGHEIPLPALRASTDYINQQLL